MTDEAKALTKRTAVSALVGPAGAAGLPGTGALGSGGAGCLVDLEVGQQITLAACWLRCQRLSVMGSHSASVPISGTPDSLLVFSTHCALMIL